MYIFVAIFHVLVCFILMGVVLLQAGKGAEVGAAFGGSSQTLFGSRGGATFLSKLTIGAAVFYMLTSLTLTVLKKERSVIPAVIDSPVKSAPATEPTATEPKPADLPTPLPTPAASEAPTGEPTGKSEAP